MKPKISDPVEHPIHFVTQRLYLRCYGPADTNWFYHMCRRNRTHLTQFEPDNVVMSITDDQDAAKALRELSVGWIGGSSLFLGAFLRSTNEFVAQVYVGLVNRDLPEYQIGYFADVDHQGQGYVTEAVRAVLEYVFIHMEALRLSLECDDTNLRSVRVAERSGMVKEGHFRENKKNVDGTISGTLRYGMLRREYFDRR